MALLKISKGKKVNLPSQIQDGKIYFTTDENKLYIDTLEGRKSLNANTADKLSTNSVGSPNRPVYFQDGKPISCVNYLNVDTESAQKLSIARTISLTGDVTGSVKFDGSKDVNITTAVLNNSHIHQWIESWGNKAPETGRTSERGSLYTYNMYRLENVPSSYMSVIGFGQGIDGTVEIAGEWTSTNKLFFRALRDCCDDWYPWRRIWVEGNQITSAVWNDYAEYRTSDCNEFGRVLKENGDDTLSIVEERLSSFAGVSSDTWGFCEGETELAKTPIAVAGRVLVYPYQDRNNYKSGDCVCAAPNGTVDIMTREEIRDYPDRIVGTVSCVPDYEEWGETPVKVNGRIWIKVK